MLTIEKCKALPTPRLLKYFQKVVRPVTYSPVCECCRWASDEEIDAAEILAEAIRKELATREHVK